MSGKINGRIPNSEKSQVTVQLVRNQLQPGARGELMVKVSVRSRMKSTSLFEGLLDTANFTSKGDAKRQVEILAGALAEKICERLGDTLLDPDVCANLAGKAWEEALLKPSSAIGVI